MDYEDKQVIDMVNAQHDRQRQLISKSRSAKRERQRRKKAKPHKANAITAMLRLAVVLEFVIIALAVGFIIVAG